MFAMEAEEAMENSSKEEDPEPKAKMQKKLDKLRCFELKLFHDFVCDEIWNYLYCSFSVTYDVQKPITTTDLSVALESVRLESSIQDEDQNQCLEV